MNGPIEAWAQKLKAAIAARHLCAIGLLVDLGRYKLGLTYAQQMAAAGVSAETWEDIMYDVDEAETTEDSDA